MTTGFAPEFGDNSEQHSSHGMESITQAFRSSLRLDRLNITDDDLIRTGLFGPSKNLQEYLESQLTDPSIEIQAKSSMNHTYLPYQIGEFTYDDTTELMLRQIEKITRETSSSRQNDVAEPIFSKDELIYFSSLLTNVPNVPRPKFLDDPLRREFSYRVIQKSGVVEGENKKSLSINSLSINEMEHYINTSYPYLTIIDSVPVFVLTDPEDQTNHARAFIVKDRNAVEDLMDFAYKNPTVKKILLSNFVFRRISERLMGISNKVSLIAQEHYSILRTRSESVNNEIYEHAHSLLQKAESGKIIHMYRAINNSDHQQSDAQPDASTINRIVGFSFRKTPSGSIRWVTQLEPRVFALTESRYNDETGRIEIRSQDSNADLSWKELHDPSHASNSDSLFYLSKLFEYLQVATPEGVSNMQDYEQIKSCRSELLRAKSISEFFYLLKPMSHSSVNPFTQQEVLCYRWPKKTNSN